MRKLLLMLLVLTIMLPFASAFDKDKLEAPYNYEALDTGISVYSSLTSFEEGSDADLLELEANLTFVPIEDASQLLISFEAVPVPDASVASSGHGVVFTWTNPKESFFSYNVNSMVKVTNTLPRIRRQHKFPLKFEVQTLGTNYSAFTLPGETIDITGEIRETASGIIEGETDYYKAVFKLADWVFRSINYSSTPETEGKVQKSSWVLENRIGVCDEKSNLFISLARAVGIPARFIGGVAYSNIKGSFGEHGWAEVYFPGEGWVPFDATYGELGWVDPAHVKMKESFDSSEPSVHYKWKARETSFKTNPLKVEAVPEAYSGNFQPLSIISLEPLRNDVAPGSYVPVQVKVENPNDFYLPLTIYIRTAPGLVEENRKAILLEPLQTSYLFWTVKIPGQAEETMLYTTYIEAEDQYGSSAKSGIQYALGNEPFTEGWALEQVQRLQPTEEKSYLHNVELSCATEKEAYYSGDMAVINCNAANKGNTRLQGLRVCYEANCKVEDIEVGESKEVPIQFKLEGREGGRVKVTAETRNLMRVVYAEVNIIKDPKLRLGHFSPEEVGYWDEGQFAMLLNMSSTAYDVEIEINSYWKASVGNLSSAREIVMPFSPKKMIRKKADIDVRYKDAGGKQYTLKEKREVRVTGIPLWIKFVLWIESLF